MLVLQSKMRQGFLDVGRQSGHLSKRRATVCSPVRNGRLSSSAMSCGRCLGSDFQIRDCLAQQTLSRRRSPHSDALHSTIGTCCLHVKGRRARDGAGQVQEEGTIGRMKARPRLELEITFCSVCAADRHPPHLTTTLHHSTHHNRQQTWPFVECSAATIITTSTTATTATTARQMQ